MIWKNGRLWELFGKVDDQFVVIGYENLDYLGLEARKLGTWSPDDGLTKYSLPSSSYFGAETGGFTEYNDAIYFYGDGDVDASRDLYKINPGDSQIEEKEEFDGVTGLAVFNDVLVVAGYTEKNGNQSVGYYDENDEIHWILEDSPGNEIQGITVEDDGLVLHTLSDQTDLLIDSSWTVTEIPNVDW